MQFFRSALDLKRRSLALLGLAVFLCSHAGANETETISQILAPVYPPLAEQIVSEFQLREKAGAGIDLGSGPGDLILELCKRTKWMHWVNADADSRVFADFLQRAEEAGFRGRVSAMLADARALPFHDAFADIVVSRGSVPFWSDRPKAFAEIYRVLKPGGVAFIGRGFPDSLPLEVAREIRDRQRRAGKEPVYDVNKTADEFRRIMRNLDIEDYRIRVPKRADVNYGIWIEFRKPGARTPPSLLERPTRESVGLELSTTVVERADMKEQGAHTVVDALEFVPGAWIESRGRKVRQFASFRGQKYPYPEYAIDGVLFREFHEVPYFLTPAEVERIEVMRSGGAMLSGNAGLVGLISVVPRTYRGRETSVAVEFGSLGAARARASHGGRVRNMSYGFGVDGYRFNGPENRHGEERVMNYFGGWTWRPSDALAISANLFHIGGSRGLVQALTPATLKLQSALEKFDPVQTSFGTLNALYRPNHRASTQLLLGYSDRHNTSVAVTPAGTTSTRDWDRELAAGVAQSFALTGGNTLRVATNFNNWVAPYGKRFYTGRRCDLETYSVAITDEQRLGRLTIDGGFRYYRTHISEYGAFNFEENSSPFRNVPAVVNTWESPAWSGTLGASYSLGESVALFGNLVSGTIEPRRGTLTASLLPPMRENRLTADVGFRISSTRLGTGSVSLFEVQRTDGLYLTGAVKTVNGRLMELYDNRDQRSKGIEIDLRSRRLPQAIQLFANFTVLSARMENAGIMRRDVETPRTLAGGGFSISRWGFDSNLFWKALSSYESQRFADPGMYRPLGGFTNLDLTLSRRLGTAKQTRIYAEVENLADEAYSTVVGYPDYGRRAVVGIEHSF